MRAYIRAVKGLIVVWLNGPVVEFFHADRMCKLFEVKLSVIPNSVRISNNLNDLLLFYKYFALTLAKTFKYCVY